MGARVASLLFGSGKRIMEALQSAAATTPIARPHGNEGMIFDA
jgi:hypothetical protein